MKTALPKLRFHEFVGVWNAKKIEDLIDAQSSQMALGKLNFANSGFPVYGADGIVGFLPTFNQYNDYISIVKDGSGVGRLTLCKKESSILSTLQYLLSKDESKYKLNWLFYLLQNVNFKEYVKGSGIPHIYYSDYKHHNVLVPEPAEQRKIAECLSSVDDLIEAVSDKVEALKEQKKGLMQKLFPTEGKTTPEFRFPEFQNDKPWDADSSEKSEIIAYIAKSKNRCFFAKKCLNRGRK
ncbi:MAG: restriction endonuclease subunit S [Rikenellaceae bacterium]